MLRESFNAPAKVPAVIRLLNHSKWPALAALSIGLAACGSSTKTADIPSGSGDTGAATTTATPTTTTTAAKPPTFAKPTAEVTKLAKAVGTDTKKKPNIEKPSGAPPKKLTVVDIVNGTGA